LGKALAGVGGVIAAANVTIYREEYYTTKTASTGMRPIGRWPDALIPSVDPLYGEVRSGFAVAELPVGENRVFWVDVLVPMAQPKGFYAGELVLSWDSGSRPISVRLDVRNFTLPSTSSLRSLFKIHDGVTPCKATHGPARTDNAVAWSTKGWSTNRDYARLALDNRITIANSQFQTPTANPDISNREGSIKDFEAYQLPLINGTDKTTRLLGARTTTFAVPRATTSAAWKQRADKGGFTDRSVLYSTGVDKSCDEPGDVVKNKWPNCEKEVAAAHDDWPTLPNVVTASIQQVVQAKAKGYTDIIVPLISQMHGSTEMHVDEDTWEQYVGDQRSEYDSFLELPGSSSAAKEVWLYTSCIAADCSSTPKPTWEGWADYTIDAAASQNRAMGWLAYRYDVSGELYYAVDQKLAIFDKGTLVSTAWTDQWFAGGNGDGTLFYPWDKARVGGETPIPIESMRMKLIRNGHQDYEYLRLAACNGHEREARAIAKQLYPSTFKTITTDAAMEAARRKLAGLAEGVTGRLTRVGCLSVTPTPATADSSVTAQFTVTNDGGNPITIKDLLIQARNSKGRNADFPSTDPLTLQPGQQYTHTAPKTFPAETYTAWAAYYDGTAWPRLSPKVSFIVK
jgi:Domain of unknown function (DUF4091)